MRRVLACCSLLLLVGLVAAQDKGPALAVGKDLPGTFHPYNITARTVELPEPDPKDKKGDAPAAKTKGKFHCLISEYNLDPVVMIFAGEVEENKAFVALLKKLDKAIEAQPGLRLRAFVVFVDKDIKKVLGEGDTKDLKEGKVLEVDAKRDKAVKRLETAFATWVPRQVVLTLAGTEDVEKYGLDPTVPVTAVLYHKLRVKAVHKIGKDGLEKEDSPAIKALLADVTDKLKAKVP